LWFEINGHGNRGKVAMIKEWIMVSLHVGKMNIKRQDYTIHEL
jgi:hypothetical protein